MTHNSISTALITKFVQVVPSHVVQLEIHVFKEENETYSWFSDEHLKEVNSLLLSVMQQRVQSDLSLRTKNRRRQRGKTQQQKRKDDFSVPQILMGETLRMAYSFKQKRTPPRHVLMKSHSENSESHYKSSQIFYEKLVVYVYHIQGFRANQVCTETQTVAPGTGRETRVKKHPEKDDKTASEKTESTSSYFTCPTSGTENKIDKPSFFEKKKTKRSRLKASRKKRRVASLDQCNLFSDETSPGPSSGGEGLKKRKSNKTSLLAISFSEDEGTDNEICILDKNNSTEKPSCVGTNETRVDVDVAHTKAREPDEPRTPFKVGDRLPQNLTPKVVVQQMSPEALSKALSPRSSGKKTRARRRSSDLTSSDTEGSHVTKSQVTPKRRLFNVKKVCVPKRAVSDEERLDRNRPNLKSQPVGSVGNTLKSPSQSCHIKLRIKISSSPLVTSPSSISPGMSHNLTRSSSDLEQSPVQTVNNRKKRKHCGDGNKNDAGQCSTSESNTKRRRGSLSPSEVLQLVLEESDGPVDAPTEQAVRQAGLRTALDDGQRTAQSDASHPNNDSLPQSSTSSVGDGDAGGKTYKFKRLKLSRSRQNARAVSEDVPRSDPTDTPVQDSDDNKTCTKYKILPVISPTCHVFSSRAGEKPTPLIPSPKANPLSPKATGSTKVPSLVPASQSDSDEDDFSSDLPHLSQYLHRSKTRDSLVVVAPKDAPEVLDCEDLFSDCFIQEHLSSQPIIKIEDTVADEMAKELASIKKISALNKDLLSYLISSNEEYLREIFQGKSFCRRHEDYKASARKRANLDWQVPLGLFGEEQCEHILWSLHGMFCKKHTKYLDYVMRVMFPEMLIKIYMDIFLVSHGDAETKMEESLEDLDPVYDF